MQTIEDCLREMEVRVTQEMNDMLLRDFTKTKIEEALYQMAD